MVSGSNNKKNKLVFAKDNKQAVLAVVSIIVFIGSMIHLKNSLNPNAAEPVNIEPVKENIAQMPQENLNDNIETVNSINQVNTKNNPSLSQDAVDIYTKTVDLKNKVSRVMINVEENSKDNDVEIIPKGKTKGKQVTIAVEDTSCVNPFLPSGSRMSVNPSLAYLTPPPETLPVNNDASKVMNTTISGILYDPYSPSAIINIEGSDYLVKKGDVINNYRVLAINKTQVLVQLGKNIYQAGVGELLSLTDLTNVTANLDRKFGGNNVQIKVRKKG